MRVSATIVILAGIGIGALGLVSGSMYIVGAVVLAIGTVGLAVRAADLLRWLR